MESSPLFHWDKTLSAVCKPFCKPRTCNARRHRLPTLTSNTVRKLEGPAAASRAKKAVAKAASAKMPAGRVLQLENTTSGETTTDDDSNLLPQPSTSVVLKTKEESGRSLLGYENVAKVEPGKPPYQNDWVPLSTTAQQQNGGEVAVLRPEERSEVNAVLEVRA